MPEGQAPRRAVGVKGRPQACVTCRRRKKGCDLVRPSCGQCRKACIPCGGYTSTKPGGPQVDGSSSSSLASPSFRRTRETDSVPSTGASEACPAVTQSDVTSAASANHTSNRQLLASHKNPRQAGLAPSSPLSCEGTKAGIIGQFWDSYFPNSTTFPRGLFAFTFGGSLDAIQTHTAQSPALAKQMLAVALATANRSPTGEPWMMRESRRLYTDALRMAAQDIFAKGPDLEQQLVATRLFSLYESFFGRGQQDHEAQARSWLLHSNGETAIVTSNSPDTYATGRAHRLFLAGRHQIIMTALLQEKRTFLSDPIWKTAPWTYYPKTPRDHLLDIFVDIPSVLEGVKAMKAWKSEAKKAEYEYLLGRAVNNINTRLLAWHKQCAFPIVPADLVEELPERVTADLLAAAHVMTLYHCLTLRCNALHQNLSGAADLRIDDDHELYELTRASRLFGHPDAGLFRLHIATFPLITGLLLIEARGEGAYPAEKAALDSVLNSGYFESLKDFLVSMMPIQPTSMLNLGTRRRTAQKGGQGPDT